MKTVLIPSNDPAFLPVIGRVYANAGYSVVYGKANLYSEYCKPSIVHLLWPEEFTEDIYSTDYTDIERFKAAINSKKLAGAYVLHSCNNLTPHAPLTSQQRSNAEKLFEAVIESSDVIHYFSEHSRIAYENKYRIAALKVSVVTRGFNYAHLSTMLPNSQAIPRTGGAKNFLVFGAIRHTAEFSLLRSAWEMVNPKDLSLNINARYFPLHSGGRLRRALRMAIFHAFLYKNNVSWNSRYISDNEIEGLMVKSDAIIVLRDGSLSSGLPLLGLTFGKLVIAPSLPVIAEYLEGTDNILYEPGNYKDLARAIETAKNCDLVKVFNSNIKSSRSYDLAGLETVIGGIDVD